MFTNGELTVLGKAQEISDRETCGNSQLTGHRFKIFHVFNSVHIIELRKEITNGSLCCCVIIKKTKIK